MRAAVLALLLALPLAAGQPPPQLDACRAPVLTVQDVTGPFRAGGSAIVQFGVENPNGPSVDAVRATVTTSAPAGWAATPAQRELTMPPNDVWFTALAITAPNRGSGQPAGNITLHVTFVCTNGEIQTSASASTVVEVEIAALSVPWPLVLGSFLVLAAGVTALGLRRLRRGVALWARTPERTVEPGKSAKFTVVVENRRGKPQRFTFLATGVPEGWSAHLALDEVELEPGEEKALWAILKAPPTAVPGAVADVALRLESPRGAREGVTTRVLARVVEPQQ
jgi:hypothetical protein